MTKNQTNESKSDLSEFLNGFAIGAGIDRDRASEQWAGFSRQLSDADRRDEEEQGFERGVEMGEEFAKFYPSEEQE